MSFGAAFLLLVVIVLFESITIFRSYMGALNSAREGAVYAAHHPDLCSGEKITAVLIIPIALAVDACTYKLRRAVGTPTLQRAPSPQGRARMGARKPGIDRTPAGVRIWPLSFFCTQGEDVSPHRTRQCPAPPLGATQKNQSSLGEDPSP
jgi:hypothetical protein